MKDSAASMKTTSKISWTLFVRKLHLKSQHERGASNPGETLSEKMLGGSLISLCVYLPCNAFTSETSFGNEL